LFQIPIDQNFVGLEIFETVISFFVNVHVLSVQITVVDQRDQTDVSFLSNAFFEARLVAAIVITIIIVVLSHSGTAATAIEIA